MKIESINSEEEYKQVLYRIYDLMDVEDDSPEGKELDRLAILANEYEAKHYSM